MRRFGSDNVTKEDTLYISTRYASNKNVELTTITQIWCDCYNKHDERNSFTNVVSEKHLEAMYAKSDNLST